MHSFCRLEINYILEISRTIISHSIKGRMMVFIFQQIIFDIILLNSIFIRRTNDGPLCKKPVLNHAVMQPCIVFSSGGVFSVSVGIYVREDIFLRIQH